MYCRIRLHSLLVVFLIAAIAVADADDSFPTVRYGEVSDLRKVEFLSGEGANLGNFLFPSLFFQATGGLFEPGASPGDFKNSEHDPANEGGIQGVEAHFEINLNDTFTGFVAGFGHMGEEGVWEVALEESYLHWHLLDWLAIGGGQFFDRVGFQQDLHLHDWFFVNQNLPNSRLINEGELILQGGEFLVRLPKDSLLTFAVGGVSTHAEEEEEGELLDPNFIEAHAGEFQNTVVSADYRFRLPFDDSIIGSASVVGGKNGFSLETMVYSFGFRKIWGGNDHGRGEPDFCSGAVMLQSEFFTREVDAFTLAGTATDFEDQGVASSIHYGINDRFTASLRHDWVSSVAHTELTERNRISAALVAFVDPEERVQVRLQYDHLKDDAIGSENVAWLQFQIQWGGSVESHAGHAH